MKNVIVIYKSIYGSTKKYANWIAEELNCDVVEVKKIKDKDLEKYDTVIFGGGLYAEGISGVGFLKKNFGKLKDKDIIVFTVGLSNPQNKEYLNNLEERNFSENMRKKISFFNLRGAIDYKKLSLIHRIMMKLFKRIVDKKDIKDITDETMLIVRKGTEKVDFVDKNTIAPIIKLVKGN